MLISFTGHRNKLAKESDLEQVLKDYPDSIWVHGGAIGFDTQVEQFARKHGIKTVVIRPDYKSYGKLAPLVRNDEIVKLGEKLIALYDGRVGGGTYYTIKRARELDKEVRVIKP